MAAARRRLAIALRRLSYRIEGPGPDVQAFYEFLKQNIRA